MDFDLEILYAHPVPYYINPGMERLIQLFVLCVQNALPLMIPNQKSELCFHLRGVTQQVGTGHLLCAPDAVGGCAVQLGRQLWSLPSGVCCLQQAGCEARTAWGREVRELHNV